jgi:hypothetical protein
MKRTMLVTTTLATAGLMTLIAGCASGPSAPAQNPGTASGAPAPAQAAAPRAQAGPAGPASRTPVMVNGLKWYLYDGSQLPQESTAGLGVGSGDGAGAAEYAMANGDGTVTIDTKDPGNKATWVFSPVVDSSPAKEFTFVARLKADNASDRGFDFDFRFGDGKGGGQGPRVKFIVKPNEVQIEKPDGESSSTVRTKLDGNEYHVYQLSFAITPAKVTTNVYVDGNDKASLSVEGNQVSSDSRLSFGDMGPSNSCKGTIDWMAWTDGAALKPSALKGKLPRSLGELMAYK